MPENVEQRHHRSQVINFLEDGTFIDTDRDIAETAVTYWDLQDAIDTRVINELDVTLTHTDDSIQIGDGDHLLAVSPNNEALVTVTQPLPAGSNNIGSVDVQTLPSLPAGSNTIGGVDLVSPTTTGDNLATALVEDQVGLFTPSDFTETRTITDIDTGGSQTDPMETRPVDHAEAFWNTATLAANGSLSHTLHAPGADRLYAQIRSTGTHDINIYWTDADNNMIRIEQIGSNISAGTWTELDLPAKSPYLTIQITDTSGSEQNVEGTLNLT